MNPSAIGGGYVAAFPTANAEDADFAEDAERAQGPV